MYVAPRKSHIHYEHFAGPRCRCAIDRVHATARRPGRLPARRHQQRSTKAQNSAVSRPYRPRLPANGIKDRTHSAGSPTTSVTTQRLFPPRPASDAHIPQMRCRRRRRNRTTQTSRWIHRQKIFSPLPNLRAARAFQRPVDPPPGETKPGLGGLALRGAPRRAEGAAAGNSGRAGRGRGAHRARHAPAPMR
jgi:hypothetical protein